MLDEVWPDDGAPVTADRALGAFRIAGSLWWYRERINGNVSVTHSSSQIKVHNHLFECVPSIIVVAPLLT